MHKTSFHFLMAAALVVTGLAASTAVQVNPPAGKQKVDPKKTLEDSKVSLALLEQEAAKGVWTAKKNGVELAIKAKGVPNKEFTDIEVAWTLTYTGPRHPLIIVQPTLTLTTGATMIAFYAAPKGKDYALPFGVISPMEFPGPNGYITDAYGGKKALPEMSNPMPGNPFPPLVEFKFRTKDWFITVPAGKSAQGVLTVSGSKLKNYLLTAYPGQFDPKEPPRLFVELFHTPWDRGEDFNFDAWVGNLYIPFNAIPALPKW